MLTKIPKALTLIVVVIALLLSIPTAAAQEPDEEDDLYGQVTAVRELHVFPYGIRFWIRIEAPHEDMASVDVTLRQNDEVLADVSLPLEASILFGYDDAIEYEFFMEYEQFPEVQFFEQLVYRIDSETVDGIPSFFEGVTRPEHRAAGTWQQTTLSGRMTLHWNSESLAGVEVVRDLTPMFALLSQYITVEPTTVVLYAPFEPFCSIITDENDEEQSVILSDRLALPCSVDLVQAAYANQNIIYLALPQVNYSLAQDELAQVAVKANYDRLWGSAEVPAWFREGLALYYAPETSADRLLLVQRASQRNQLLRLSALQTLPADDDAEMWFAHAAVMMDYVADQFGADGPMQIAGLINDDTAFDEAFMEVAGVDVFTFYATWQIWVDTARAVQVADWNPYQPQTPTPTLTLVPSAVPPTRTPAPTATITPTRTLRPLFVPTNPPTLTRAPPTRRPTLTVTPLPPGFFDQQAPTALPAATNSGNNNNDALCGAGLGTLLLPLGAMAVSKVRRHRG